MAAGTNAAPKTNGERIAALESAYERVATKADVLVTKADIEKLKDDLTWRIVIAMCIMTGISVAVAKLPA